MYIQFVDENSQYAFNNIKKAIISEEMPNYNGSDINSSTSVIRLANTDIKVEYKLYYSVKKFGAKGDGNHNDTSAFQRGIEYCSLNGYVLYVPPGTYMIRQLQVVNNMHIVGAKGAILKTTGNTYYNEESKYLGDLVNGNGKTNITIENITLDGNIEKFPIGDTFNVYHGIALLNLRACNNITIKKCIFQNNAYGAIKADAGVGEQRVSNVTVEDCQFINVDSGINMQHQGPKNVTIKNCLFDGHAYSEPIVIEPIIAGSIAENIEIYGNSFMNKTGGATIWLGSDENVNCTKNVKIHDNTVYNMNTGFSLHSCNDVSIYHNSMTSMYNGIIMYQCDGIDINNNTIDGYSEESSIVCNYAIIGTAVNSKVTNNTFLHIRNNDILLLREESSEDGYIKIIGENNILDSNSFSNYTY